MAVIDGPRATPARLRAVASYFLWLGCTGFGGPQAVIAMMEEECVHRRRWLDRDRFLEGLGLCNLLPGPASTQLGIWIGYLRAGWPGGIVAGVCFLLPAFAMLVVAAWAYFSYRTRWDLDAWFFGLHAAVIALILVSCQRLARSCVKRPWQWGLLAGGFAATVAGLPIVLTLVAAGTLVLLVAAMQRRRPSVLAVDPVVLVTLALFFLKVGAFVYGGGLVILPFIQQEVVGQRGWLTAREFADGVALGQVTPGPVAITAAFIGYHVAQTHALPGIIGATVATVAIFLPSFVLVLAVAPWLRRVRDVWPIQAFFEGINVAVVGAILGAAIPLALAAVREAPPIAVVSWLAMVAGAVVLSFRGRIAPPVLLAVAALIGYVVRHAVWS